MNWVSSFISWLVPYGIWQCCGWRKAILRVLLPSSSVYEVQTANCHHTLVRRCTEVQFATSQEAVVLCVMHSSVINRRSVCLDWEVMLQQLCFLRRTVFALGVPWRHATYVAAVAFYWQVLQYPVSVYARSLEYLLTSILSNMPGSLFLFVLSAWTAACFVHKLISAMLVELRRSPLIHDSK